MRGRRCIAQAVLALAGLVVAIPAPAGALTVAINLLYVHGVKNCSGSRQNAEDSLADLAAAVDAALPARIAAFEAAHPGVTVQVNSALANLYTATPSGIHPSDSPNPLNMDDWEVGDPGCSTTQQGDPCTTTYEWRYRLAQEINRLYPAPAANIILIGHSTGARTAMEVAANVGPSGAVGSFNWGVQSRIAGVMTVHGMLDAIGTSQYNVVGITSFETACKNGDAIVGFGDSCAPGNGWCEYAGRVDGFPASDWVAQNRRALMLSSWGSCSPSAWTGQSDGSLPYDAQGSPWAVGLDMAPAPGQTYRPSHGQRYGAFCHSALTNNGDSQHAAARDAARQRLLDWLFVAAPRVAATGSNSTPSIGFNQFSATFGMGSTCPSPEVDDTVTSGTKGLGIDVVGVCHHPGFFDGDDHAIALGELSVTNGATCNGTYRWQQAHDSNNNHAANFWWKTRSLFADGPDLMNHVTAATVARCGDGTLDPGEGCDDGNTASGDCCSASCEAVTSGTSCASDGNVCTTDICNGFGACVHPVNVAPCNDGVFCNGADTCSGGACSVHAGDPCAVGLECNRTCNEAADSCAAASGSPCADDGNVCTSDACNGAGACAHPPNSAPCSDGLFCNGADTCGGGACSVHAGDPCAGGPECNRTCNEVADTCAAAAGVACGDDGNACTSDTCNGAGACAHPATPSGSACPNDGNGCTDDRCNGAGVCTHPANTASCDDGLFCNGADTCSGGSCTLHAGDPCAGGTECNRSCNEAVDGCLTSSGAACGDDGNPCTDDVCNGAGTCAHPANTNGCDDGNACTAGDLCSDGACVPGPTPPCGRCAACDAQLGCVVRPQAVCKRTGPGDALLRLRDAASSSGDKLLWKWRHGQATALSELGAPASSDDYTLCVFDESSASPQLRFAATVPGGDLCGVASCWRLAGRTLSYKDRDRTPEGVDSIRISTGADGRAGVLVKGKGAHLSDRADGLPAPPLGLPLRVQLQATTGACWEATYGSAQVNRPGSFKADSD